MASFLPPPTYYSGTFYSECASIEVGCCVRMWDPILLKYVDADDGRGSQFSDGTYCYRIQNCIVVEKTLCQSALFVRLCSDSHTDSAGNINIFGWFTTEPDGGTIVGGNALVLVDYTISFLTNPTATANGQIMIGTNYVNGLLISTAQLTTTQIDIKVIEITINNITVYGTNPRYASPTAGSEFPVPMVRTYYIGQTCTYDYNPEDVALIPPPNSLIINEYTQINIFYSLGTDGFLPTTADKMIATRTIFEGLKYSPVLMNCLLPKYKNDIKLYERMVVVVPAFTERTFRQIKFVNVPYTRNNNGPVPNFPPGQTKRYVNILFQTEAIDSYHDKCERASTLSEYTSVPWWTRNVGLDPSTWFPNLTTKFLSWLGNPEAKKLIADKERGKRLFDDSVELQTFRDTANVSNPYYWRGFIYSLAFRVVRPVSYSCQNFEDLLRMSMTGEQLKATLGSNGFVEYSFFPGFVVIQGSLTPTIGLSGPDLRWATNTINTTDSPGPSPYSHSYFKNLIVNALVELGYQNPCP